MFAFIALGAIETSWSDNTRVKDVVPKEGKNKEITNSDWNIEHWTAYIEEEYFAYCYLMEFNCLWINQSLLEGGR